MANPFKLALLREVSNRLGEIKKLAGSESLFEIGRDAARLYVRYSKVHKNGRTFFGLREFDLRRLEGYNSYICFLFDDSSPPIFLPFVQFEEVFRGAKVAAGGQYKAQVDRDARGRELYLARRGRFNLEGYVGFEVLERGIRAHQLRPALNLSHCQIQSLLAGIGHSKGYDIFVPLNDRDGMDWALTKKFTLAQNIPRGFSEVEPVLSEVDVIWIQSGRNRVEALFEVEHSTPMYSGLLRFNDVLLTKPDITRFVIVSNDDRRGLFSRQLTRPAFRKSGLSELVSFLEYANVADWHSRISAKMEVA